MRYLVHDYSGHPFQAHLSRQLAIRGHEVNHVYFADNPGPKGLFEVRPSDPSSLRFIGIRLGGRTHAAGTGSIGFRRLWSELAYGRQVARMIARLKPDLVLCGNTPADAQRFIISACKQHNTRFVYWVQDIYSVAVSTLLTRKFGLAGKAIGWYYHWLDGQQFRASDGIIAISPDFVPIITPFAPSIPISVIENWAGIDELPVVNKDNNWSRQHQLQDRFVYLYSGTLGRKHNPGFLMKLAERCQSGDTVVAVAQGFGVPMLETAKAERSTSLQSLKLLPIQPAKDLAQVLGTADVLLATIEADAGRFAVPSKVLSYLCAGRPILLAASKNNLAARTLVRANAGIVVEPNDEAGFIAAARQLRFDPQLRAELGANGRRYAENTFDLERITDKFETAARLQGVRASHGRFQADNSQMI